MPLQLTLLTLQPINPPTPKHRGRPSLSLTAAELTEIMQSLFNPAEYERIRRKYSVKKIKDAINIFRTDFGKQGVISRKTCPYHRRAGLIFNWHGYTNGVRVRCVVDGCLWKGTHFEPGMFHSDVMMDTEDGNSE